MVDQGRVGTHFFHQQAHHTLECDPLRNRAARLREVALRDHDEPLVKFSAHLVDARAQFVELLLLAIADTECPPGDEIRGRLLDVGHLFG
jgi:hypothetical protein